MTARDLANIGVVFERVAGRVARVGLPPDRQDLGAVVSAEIARRVEMMREPPRVFVPAGHCDACGGGMEPPWDGGWCALCEAARARALRAEARAA